MSRLGELTEKVDAFFARVAERHGTDMQCRAGCSDCCHVQLTITGVEAMAIRDLVAGWPAEQRRDLAGEGDPNDREGTGLPVRQPDAVPLTRSIDLGHGAEDHPPGRNRCAALDPSGRCKIYDARPLVCRSHGVPIRMRQGGLPVVQACHRNFTRITPDPDCVLDQTTLSAMLYAVDAAEGRATGLPGEPMEATREVPEAAGNPAEAPTARAGGAPPGPGDQPGGRIELARLLADLAAI